MANKIVLILAFSAVCIMVGGEMGVRSARKQASRADVAEMTDAAEQPEDEKMPDTWEMEEAENNCKEIMELIAPIYINADKGSAMNAVVSEETIDAMAEKIAKAGIPVMPMKVYSDMQNYEKAEAFLNAALEGTAGSLVIYRVHTDGGVEREKFIYDGENMYNLSVRAVWNEKNEPEMTKSFLKISDWHFRNGWFGYVLNDAANSCYLLRIEPMDSENREASEYVRRLGYQGNNLLCSDWDKNNMEKLDYNGLYEYLYIMKYGEPFTPEEYEIPKEDFESIIAEYMPITKDEIRDYAVFNEESGRYGWAPLFCLNYSPNFFGTAVPEVTDIRKNGDGTITLTVNAVCEMSVCDEAFMTHELTIKTEDDGSFKYEGNKILDGEANYQYRLEGR